MADSPRWCDICRAWGDHHTDRHPQTWKEKIAADTARVMDNPRYLGNMVPPQQPRHTEDRC